MFRPQQIKRFESTLIEYRDIAKDVREFIFSTPQDITFTPGQFITIFFSRNNQRYRRQYSIKSTPHTTKQVHIIVKYVANGPGSDYLWSLHKNDTVDVMMPLGVFVIRDEQKQFDLTFLATGTGVAPFLSMIESLLLDGFQKNITLIVGYRHELLCHDMLEKLSQMYPKFTYIPTLTKPLDPHYTGRVGRIQEVLTEIEPSIDQQSEFYICGLYAMIQDVGLLLKKMGRESKKIHFERGD